MQMNKALPGLVLLLVLLGVAALTLLSGEPPAALPASAPPDQFSAERALQHVRAIAVTPHPVGSPADAAARDYVVAQLRALGLEPQVQRALGVRAEFAVAGVVDNVLARLPGTAGGGKAVLLMTHYDSAPSGPGASDDASGVATLLETARALQAGARLRNDVIFLFTDGEESGLLGASAFQAGHPWAGDAGLVLNFEARGNTGPVFMFETGYGNARLIPGFARAASRPVANSLMNAVYQALPNDTDFTVFKEAGVMGLNFAYIDGASTYHTPLDNVANLDVRSLQHDGLYALELTRHFGNLDLAGVAPTEPDAVYFNLVGPFLIYYPGAWAVPLALLAALGYMILAAVGLWRRRISSGDLTTGIAVFLLNTLLGLGLVWLAWTLANLLHPAYAALRLADIYNAPWYWLAFTALAVAATAALYNLVDQKASTAGLALGALFWWLILALATAGWAPGASYEFIWPLVAALLGQAALMWRGGRAPAGWIDAAVLAVAALPAVILHAPLAVALYGALGFQMSIIGAAVVLLLLGLLLPHLAMIRRPYRWALPALALLVAVGAFAGGSLTARFDAAHPWPNEVVYGLDAASGRAYWLGFANPDAWTAQFLGEGQSGTLNEFYARAQGDFPKAPAAALALPAPQAEVLGDETAGVTRTLRLKLTSPRGAPFMYFYVVSPQGGALQIGGRRMAGRSALQLSAPPPEGFEVAVEVPASGGPVRVLIVDRTPGLPALPGFAPRPRPADMMLAPDPDADSTMVSNSFEFR